MKVTLITLVIPCFNEDLTIGEFYRRAKAFSVSMEPRQFEFIFINDGSTDKTSDILNQIAANDKTVKVLHLAQNMGHQIALTAGLDYACGDMIVTIDADLQDPPELIKEMLDKIEQGYDIVHGQRRRRFGESIFKIVSAQLFYRTMKWISDTPIIQNCGDFRAFTQSVLKAISAFRMPHRFLRGIFVQIGFNQCIIQYDRDVRYAGTTKYPLIKMAGLSIDAMLSFSAAPIRLITCMSLLLWAVSLIYLIKSLVEHFILHITVPGWTSIIVMLFFFTGLILFCLSIIGSYIGRIFHQGQKKPLYWLSDARNLDLEKVKLSYGQCHEVLLSEQIVDMKQRRNP